MSDNQWCGNPDVLMSYLYEEGDSGERQAFEAHISQCAGCSREVREFTALRTGLAQWAPPDTLLDFRVVRQDPAPVRRSWFSLPVLPAWAQLGAAAMLVGVAVNISGLEVRYDDKGVTVRTGWQQQASPVSGTPPSTQAAVVAASTDAAPWRADVASVEERLRRELQQPVAAGGPSTQMVSTRGNPMNDEAFLARVQELISASELRQDRELAMRIAQVVRDVTTQRRTDLARVTDGMGVIEGRTVSAVAQQRQMIDYLMRVSQQRDPRQ